MKIFMKSGGRETKIWGQFELWNNYILDPIWESGNVKPRFPNGVQ